MQRWVGVVVARLASQRREARGIVFRRGSREALLPMLPVEPFQFAVPPGAPPAPGSIAFHRRHGGFPFRGELAAVVVDQVRFFLGTLALQLLQCFLHCQRRVSVGMVGLALQHTRYRPFGMSTR